jgi:hypothetical protein
MLRWDERHINAVRDRNNNAPAPVAPDAPAPLIEAAKTWSVYNYMTTKRQADFDISLQNTIEMAAESYDFAAAESSSNLTDKIITNILRNPTDYPEGYATPEILPRILELARQTLQKRKTALNVERKKFTNAMKQVFETKTTKNASSESGPYSTISQFMGLPNKKGGRTRKHKRNSKQSRRRR